jgi:hypothetical protein
MHSLHVACSDIQTKAVMQFSHSCERLSSDFMRWLFNQCMIV